MSVAGKFCVLKRLHVEFRRFRWPVSCFGSGPSLEPSRSCVWKTWFCGPIGHGFMTRSRGLSLTLDACAEEEMIRSKGFINGRTDGTRTQEPDGIMRTSTDRVGEAKGNSQRSLQTRFVSEGDVPYYIGLKVHGRFLRSRWAASGRRKLRFQKTFAFLSFGVAGGTCGPGRRRDTRRLRRKRVRRNVFDAKLVRRRQTCSTKTDVFDEDGFDETCSTKRVRRNGFDEDGVEENGLEKDRFTRNGCWAMVLSSGP